MISQAYCATEFSIARFLVPLVAKSQWALFCDGDFMFRADIQELLAQANPRYAVQVVKHEHHPAEALKMDQQVQTSYPRKNWSSLMLFNMSHAANRIRLTRELVDTEKGINLHQFCWLKDHEIGEIDESWNWIEGHSPNEIDPKAVHFSRGTPDMIECDPRWAKEWWNHTTYWKPLCQTTTA